MDGGNGVFCLVVADHLDLPPFVLHQGYHLPWSLHKRLAVALELNVTGWVDHLDPSTSLSIEKDPIAAIVVPSAVIPREDGDVVGVDLAKDREGPRGEIWDVNKHPGFCPEPQHLHRAKKLAIVTKSAGNVDLLV